MSMVYAAPDGSAKKQVVYAFSPQQCALRAVYEHTRAWMDYYTQVYEAVTLEKKDLYHVAGAWRQAGIQRQIMRLRIFKYLVDENALHVPLQAHALLRMEYSPQQVSEWKAHDPHAMSILERIERSESRVTQRELDALQTWIHDSKSKRVSSAIERRDRRDDMAWKQMEDCLSRIN